MAEPLPSVDQLLGPAPGAGGAPALPSPDEVLGPPPGPGLGTHLMRAAHLDLFGQGFAQGWGTAPLGASADQELRKAGIFNDYQAGQTGLMRDFNETLLHPLLAGADAALRLPYALARGLAEAAPLVGGPIAAGMEAFPAGHLTGLPVAIPPRVPQGLAAAADTRVIGAGEAGWKGVAAAPEPEPEAQPAAPVPPAMTAPAEEAPAPAADVHQTARQIAPEAFGEYDRLQTRKDVFRRWLDELAQTRQANAEANAPGVEEIAALQQRIETANPRMAKIYQDRLAPLIEARDRFIEEATSRDTPDMTRVRNDLMATDFRMRDLAEPVSTAYRQARALLPEDQPAPEIAAAVPQMAAAEAPATPVAETEPPVQAPGLPPGEVAEPAAEPAPRQAAMQTPLPRGGIAGDVARQLTAAGRPADEAQAAGEIVNAYYETRAARFAGRAGSPEDLYAADGATIRGGAQGGRGGLAAGKTAVRDGQATITLFARADASTFMHESAHQWLEQLLSDAADPRASDELRADAKAVRDWAGAGPSRVLPVRQHERFARAFESYLMEGRAPTTRLAGVFAQFRAWLMQIYQAANRMRRPISPDIRGVFDRMLTTAPISPIIAPERAPALMFEDAHQAASEAARPPAAAALAETVRGERDQAAGAVLSDEASHDLDSRPTPGAATEAGAGAPRDLLADRGGDERQIFGRGPSGFPPPGDLGSRRGLVAAQGDRAPVAAEVIWRRARGNPETALREIPPAPQRLAEFLRRAGGVRDEGGELAAMDAGRRRRGAVPGKGLINPEGMSLDEAAAQATEAGFLPENAIGNGAATPRELLEAVARDLRGEAVYSEQDREAVNAFQDALKHNAEMERIGREMGIDPRDWTREQFYNLAAAHQSAEAFEADQASRLAAMEHDVAEAERRAEEWAANRGEAWSPDHFSGPPRDLGDIENEERAEAEAHGGTGEGPGGVEQPRPAGGDQGALQARVGQRGRGAGDGSRAAEAGELERAGAAGEAVAARPFAKGGTRLLDKAGNIRLDNLNLPDAIDEAIREAAARNDNFRAERRGEMSDGEVLDLAESIGKDPAFLDRKKIGDAFNAEEIRAARGLLAASATRVYEAMERAADADGGEPEILAMAQAIARHEMIQGRVAQATAEWGRAGRAFRALSEGGEDAEDLAQFLKENSGRTFFQLQEIARYGRRLRNTGAVSRLVAETANGKIKRAMLYYYINALISGPITHLRYSVGNALNALWTPIIEIPTAAAIGAGREALGYGERGVYLGEAGAQLYGLMKGSRDGFRAAVDAWQTGRSSPLPGERVPQSLLGEGPPIYGPIGRALGIPGRSVSAIHSFFKALRYEQNIQGLAYRDAMKRGLDGDAFDRHVAYLTEQPSPDMIRDAAGNALKELYMTPADYHSFAGALVRATDKNILAKIMMPFLRIGSQITRNAFIERTPLGLASSEVRGNLAMRAGPAASDMQAAKITAGVGLAGATVLMAAEGLATGDGPTDPAQRAVWLLNHKPNHFQIGDISIPYQGLGSLGMLMRFSANMYETAHGWDGEDGGKLAVSFLEGATRAVLDENFMRGLKDALDAVYHPQEYGMSYLRNFATNWLPFSVGLGQVARAIDPYQREVGSVFDAARARIPFLRQTLPARRDSFGELIPSAAPLPQYQNDPVVQQMKELQIGVGRLDKKIRGVPLDDQQFDDFSRIAGRMAKQRLDAMARLPAFERLPPPTRIEMMHKAIADSREAARNLIMAQNPEILQAAMAAKHADAGGGGTSR